MLDSQFSKYNKFQAIKVNVFYLLPCQSFCPAFLASLSVVCPPWLILWTALLDPLIWLLSMYWLNHCLEIVRISTLSTFFAICRGNVLAHALTHFTWNISLLLHSRCLIVTFLHTVSDSFKLYSLLYCLALFLCPLYPYTTCPYQHMLIHGILNVLKWGYFHKISSIMPSSLSPPMNCYVSSMSYSLYSHSAALVCSLPIHSLADILPFLCNLWYCSDIMILLCHDLNLLLKTEKRPFVFLHFSSS